MKPHHESDDCNRLQTNPAIVTAHTWGKHSCFVAFAIGVACFLSPTHSVAGGGPRLNIIRSCLTGKSTAKSVIVDDILAWPVKPNDGYDPRHHSIDFQVGDDNRDIGYIDIGRTPPKAGKRENRGYLIFGQNMYPIGQAKRIDAAFPPPLKIAPESASWIFETERGMTYFCIAVNYRKGYNGAWILLIDNSRDPIGKLMYFEADTFKFLAYP